MPRNPNSKQHKVRVLAQYPRAIVHLRDQRKNHRLGLVVGAGLSKWFNIPDWLTLVNLLASDPKVNGTEILEGSKRYGLPYKTELLFQHFRRNERTRLRGVCTDREFSMDVEAKWRQLLKKYLYKGAQEVTSETIRKHPYLASVLRLVREVEVTVTYNFDDVLERALYRSRAPDQKESSRGYVTISSSAFQLRGRGRGPVIYHPNGLIPRAHLMESPSDRLIFSEHAYADHVMDFLSGDHSRLITYLADHTCLLVGLSLDDQGVRNLLRQSAKINPGNYHYQVRYVTGRSRINEAERYATIQTNFHIYNLITLFLDDQQIAALAELVSMDDEEFDDFAESNGIQTKFLYYLTGPLGVGKSTAITALSCLSTFDEWVEPRISVLAKPWPQLSKRERAEADRWIARQFKLKNDNVRKKKSGLFVLDRGPLDPVAFTVKQSWKKKAKSLLSSICPSPSNWSIQPGCVVLMIGDHEEMSLRLRLTSRNWKPMLLQRMQADLKKAYGDTNIVPIDTTGLSPAQVVQRIAHLIHLENYNEANLHERLNDIMRRGAA